MQTFLPYKSFKKSAQTLDYKRLGKQRLEAWSILEINLGKPCRRGKSPDKESRWKHHPATKLWKGYEKALCQYGIEICQEWIRRGYKDSMLPKFLGVLQRLIHVPVVYPPIIFREGFTEAHRSNLLRKNKEFYLKFFGNMSDTLPYIWR